MRRRLPFRQLLVLAGLLLVAYSVRLYRLDYQSIWWDEGISLHLATSGVSEIIRDRQNNIHPPLYFIILKGWLALVGVSAFTGRYLSVIASLGQVAVVFSAVRFWSKRAGIGHVAIIPWLTALFMLIAPLSVIYGQEIRVYAFLPLIYLATLLLAEIHLSSGRSPLRPLIYLALLEWFGLHLHYIAIFGVAYIAIWGALVFIRRRDMPGLRRWIIAHVLVVLASLPWLVGVIRNWSAIQAEANAGTFTTLPVPVPYLIAQVWAFHLTGLAGALSSEFVQVMAVVAALLLTGLLAIRAADDRQNRIIGSERVVIFRLVMHWMVPLAAGLAVWSVRSFSHPRYIIMFALMLIPAAVFLMVRSRRWVARVAAVGLALSMVVLSFWGLGRYFFDPGAAKPDMRGVARYLESTAQVGDLILIPDTDWSLPFEYRGEATVVMPHLDESPFAGESSLARALDCEAGPPCAETGRVFTVEYDRGTRDWQDRLPFELARRGYRVSETAFEDLGVREYRLGDSSGPLPSCDSSELARPPIRFNSLDLEAAWIAPDAASDTAVTVALCWRLRDEVTETLSTSIFLRDPITGERLAQADTMLLNEAGAPTPYWPVGESIITYHLLPLSPGTPPLDAELLLGIYGNGDDDGRLVEAVDGLDNPVGELIRLGNTHLATQVGLADSAYNAPLPPLWDEPVTLTNGLELAGASFSPGPYRPGQTIRVGLTWRKTGDSVSQLDPALVLEKEGDILDENHEIPVNGRYPIDRWPRDQYVFEFRDLRAPAGAEGGAQLVVIAGDGRIELGQIEIEGSTALLDRPPIHTTVDARFGDSSIALIGFDPPPELLQPNVAIPLTLYWQSLTGQITTGYTVFTHLLAEDGHLIAQHDSPPANGQRPTDEWISGEFIIDPHELIWRDLAYSGPAQLAVGLYDPATGERLATSDGTDAFLLPLPIIVESVP